MKTTKKDEQRLSLKNSGLVPTIQLELDFYRTYCFGEVVDNFKIVTYMKFKNVLMTGCKDVSKKLQNYPTNVGFPLFVPPRCFQKSSSVTFVPLWCPNLPNGRTGVIT